MDRSKTHYEIGVKDQCIETCFSQKGSKYTLLIFQKRAKAAQSDISDGLRLDEGREGKRGHEPHVKPAQ